MRSREEYLKCMVLVALIPKYQKLEEFDGPLRKRMEKFWNEPPEPIKEDKLGRYEYHALSNIDRNHLYNSFTKKPNKPLTWVNNILESMQKELDKIPKWQKIKWEQERLARIEENKTPLEKFIDKYKNGR